MSIPKKIHYCWFGGASEGKQMERCLQSWQRACPNYEIIRWDEKNSPLQDNEYVKQAYQAQKWAFVSDYVRVKVLSSQGGIYLDTDVELLKSLDSFLDCNAFLGFESPERVATCLMGCKPQHPFFIELCQQYQHRPFLCAEGDYDETTNVEMFTEMLTREGLVKNNLPQTVCDVTIYSADFFSPKDLTTGKITITENTYAIHYFNASWLPTNKRINTKIAQLLGPKLTQYIKQRLGRV